MSDTKSEGWWAIVGQQRTDSLGIKLSVCKSCKTVKKMKETIRITEKVTKHQKQGGGLNFYYLYYFTIFI